MILQNFVDAQIIFQAQMKQKYNTTIQFLISQLIKNETTPEYGDINSINDSITPNIKNDSFEKSNNNTTPTIYDIEYINKILKIQKNYRRHKKLLSKV